MANIVFFWIEEPDGNAEHNPFPKDIEFAYETAREFTTSRSSGLPAFYGFDRDGNRIFVVYREIDATTWYVVTAFPSQREDN